MANRGKEMDGYATVSANWFLSKMTARGKDCAERVSLSRAVNSDIGLTRTNFYVDRDESTYHIEDGAFKLFKCTFPGFKL